jgi:hypothetical protein
MQMPILFKQLEQKVGKLFVRASSLTMMVVFILHVFACCFNYVAVLSESTETPTWVEASGIIDSNSEVERYASQTA